MIVNFINTSTLKTLTLQASMKYLPVIITVNYINKSARKTLILQVSIRNFINTLSLKNDIAT